MAMPQDSQDAKDAQDVIARQIQQLANASASQKMATAQQQAQNYDIQPTSTDESDISVPAWQDSDASSQVLFSGIGGLDPTKDVDTNMPPKLSSGVEGLSTATVPPSDQTGGFTVDHLDEGDKLLSSLKPDELKKIGIDIDKADMDRLASAGKAPSKDLMAELKASAMSKMNEEPKSSQSNEDEEDTGATIPTATHDGLSEAKPPAAEPDENEDSESAPAPSLPPTEPPTAPGSDTGLGALTPSSASSLVSAISKPDLREALLSGTTLGTVSNMKKAQDARDMAVLTNELGKSALLLGSGIGGAMDKGVVKPEVNKEGLQIFDQNIKDAQSIVGDLQQQIATEKTDPTSRESAIFRDFMGKYGFPVDPNMTAEQAMQLLPLASKEYDANLAREASKNALAAQIANNKAKADELSSYHTAALGLAGQKLQTQKDITAQKLDAQQDVQEARAQQQQDKASTGLISKYQQNLNKDKEYTTAITDLDNYNRLDAQADQALTNPRTASTLPVQVARSLISGGRINQREIEAAGGAKDIMDRAERMAKTMTQGTMTQNDYTQLKDWVNLMKNSATSAKTTAEDRYTTQYGRVSNKNPDDSRLDLGLGPKSYSPQQEQAISAVMQAGGKSRQDAIDFLKQNGRL
jgi:hypothetical protein